MFVNVEMYISHGYNLTYDSSQAEFYIFSVADAPPQIIELRLNVYRSNNDKVLSIFYKINIKENPAKYNKHSFT